MERVDLFFLFICGGKPAVNYVFAEDARCLFFDSELVSQDFRKLFQTVFVLQVELVKYLDDIKVRTVVRLSLDN